jgi:hypothetical protein
MVSYVVQSRDRTINSPSSSYFKVPIQPAINGAQSVKLKWLGIPNTIYNVRAGVNNMIYWTDNQPVPNTQHSSPITPGIYTISTLGAAVVQQMNLGAFPPPGPYTFSVNPNTLTAEINGGATLFSLQFSKPASCAALLGFPPVDTGTVEVQLAPNVPALEVPTLFITIPELGSSAYATGGMSYTFVVPIMQNPCPVIQFKDLNASAQRITLSKQTISQLTVGLYLYGNELVNLNGTEWSFQLDFDV